MLRYSALSLVIVAALLPIPAEAGLSLKSLDPTRVVKKVVKVVEVAAKQTEREVSRTSDRVGAEIKRENDDVTHAVEIASKQTESEVSRTSDRVGAEIKRESDDVTNAVEITAKQTETNFKHGTDSLIAEVKREGEDAAVAVKEVGYFADRQQRDLREQVMALESNFRNGEWDRIAGFTFYTWKNTSENAGRAMQDSAVLRGIGQVAASAYGGPAGGAAFAAWFTYTATGDIESALKVGAVAWASGEAVASISGSGAGPDATGVVAVVEKSMSAGDIAGRALATGTVSATAAVALGGEKNDVEKAFLMGAATSAASDIYQSTAGKPLDARHANEPAVCKLAGPGQACSAPADAYVEVEPDVYRVRVESLPARTNMIGTEVASIDTSWALKNLGNEGSPIMTGISWIPGMNAGANFHDVAATGLITPLLEASIPPAMGLTYIATGAPLVITLADTAAEAEQHKE